MGKKNLHINATPSFTQGEYWILQSLVEYSIPVTFYWGSQLQVEQMFNKDWHCLSKTDLIKTLDALFQRGLVEFSRGMESEELLTPSCADITAMLSEPPPDNPASTSCSLTQLGGQLWEAFALPDWSKFIIGGTYLPPEVEDGWCDSYAEGTDRNRLQRYIDGLHHVGTIVDTETVIWKKEEPWEATYWKTLPEGYSVTFKSKEILEGFNWKLVPQDYMEIYDSRWYK